MSLSNSTKKTRKGVYAMLAFIAAVIIIAAALRFVVMWGGLGIVYGLAAVAEFDKETKS